MNTQKNPNRIDHIRVEIYPCDIDIDGTMEMQIFVTTNAGECSRSEVFSRNIMKSLFDQVFDQAKEEIKYFMLNER